MNEILKGILTPAFVYSIIRVTTPILFAALGALITDLAGVINIALEGIMLTAAFFGVLVSAFTQNMWLGLLAGVLSGVGIALILGYFSLNLKTDLILAGIAINLLASGGTIFLLYIFAGDKGTSSSLKSLVLPNINIPILKDIPILGPMFSGHHILTYIAIISVVIVHYFLYHTPLGLRLRAVGENPDAADSVGISVIKIKYIALMLSGIFAGLGGVHLSMGYVSWFARDMTSGRGFIALAAETLGGRTAIGTTLGSLVFGAADALSYSLQAFRMPSEFAQSFPFIITILALGFYAQQQISRAKKRKAASRR